MSRIYPASTVTVLQVTAYKLHDKSYNIKYHEPICVSGTNLRTIKETLALYWIPLAEFEKKLNGSHELSKGSHDIQRRRRKEEPPENKKVIDYEKSKKRLGSKERHLK